MILQMCKYARIIIGNKLESKAMVPRENVPTQTGIKQSNKFS